MLQPKLHHLARGIALLRDPVTGHSTAQAMERALVGAQAEGVVVLLAMEVEDD